MLQVISLGAGVQSSVMALKADCGEFTPRPDVAIFADTQFEPPNVYDHLDWLEQALSFPVVRVTAGDLRAVSLSGLDHTGKHKFQQIPLFAPVERDGRIVSGIGKRECTTNYKIAPIRQEIRRRLGLGPRQKGPREIVVQQWMGISRDEVVRMKPCRDRYIENVFPLIEAGMTRRDCKEWFAARYPGRILPRSACAACPYRSNVEWRALQREDPAGFADAVAYDAELRRDPSREPRYVHRSLLPLAEIDFRNLEDLGQNRLFEDGFASECEGMCGV